MFITNTINISSKGEDRTLTAIYTNIDAQIYKKTIKLDNSVSENTLKEIVIIIIDGDKTNIREGNIVTYIDDFGKNRSLKIAGMEMIPALNFKKLIEIKCDLK